MTPKLSVPDHIVRPSYVNHPEQRPPARVNQVHVNSGEEIERMRKANALAHHIRLYAGSLVKVGVTTDEIDRLVHAEIVARGAYPSPLGYHGFPKSICTSVNQVICHGIPDLRPLEEGDILKIDTSLFFGGVHGDCCASYIVGKGDEAAHKLLAFTQRALKAAIAECRPGALMSVVGKTINGLADDAGYGVVMGYSGHGLGKHMHMFPDVQHTYNSSTIRMRPGQVFTIEPMITEGSPDHFTWADQWTVVTVDGSRCAQFEEAVLITDTGAEVITR